MTNNPLVSIIIPVYNEENVIERLLKSINAQTYKNWEIIVIDDGSTDETPEIAKKYTEKVYLKKHAERSVQRNFGASVCKGIFFLFLDADMGLSKNVVKDCVTKMSSANLGAVAIPEWSIANTFWEKVKAHERSFYNEKGDATTDAARFFKRSVFEKVGGYDETITGPEDWDLPERIKKESISIGRISSKIYHYERVLSPFKLAQKKYYYALTSHRYLKKHGISPFSAKTIYFLRPIFYRNWRMLILHPILSSAMFFMLTWEQIGGGLGYFIGKIKNL